MPRAARKPCTWPGCGTLVDGGQRHCERHARQSQQEFDARRGSATSRGYGGRWDKASKSYLREHPLCAYCALHDHVRGATLVDHLYPHRGDTALFWATQWWVASCKACHDSFKQSLERAGGAALDDLARRLGRPTRAGAEG